MVKQRVWVFYVISLCVVLLDQWSKQAVVAHFNYAQPYPVFPWLNITLLHNFGAAFSFLGGQGGWQIIFLAGLSLLMTIVVCVWLYRSSSQYVSLRCALSLILGGALGNLIDRVRLRYVIDFVDFHIGSWHFAVFNLADSAITIGAIFLILHVLRTDNKS